MNRKENSSLDKIAPTKLPFPDLVSYEVVSGAGFNNWEPSMGYNQDRHTFMVHIGDQILHPNVNIIVGYRIIHEGKRLLYEWYFGTFGGKPRGKTNGEETEEFDRKVRNILKPENVVDGRSLERRIKSVIEKK